MANHTSHPNQINESFKYYHLAQNYREQGAYVQAIEHYQKTIALNPSFQAPYTILLYMNIGPKQLESLIQTYRTVLEKWPHLYFAWYNLGDALTQKKDYQSAKICYRHSCYQQAISSDPKFSQLDWPTTKKYGPDFIIIGAARCGTSSLHRYLNQHPNILLPFKKELSFFPHNMQYGLDWYLAHFPTVADGPEFITGEASTNYFDLPIVPPLLHRIFPETKLILLLRNPIERAISWHYHKVRAGSEQRSLEDAIFAEMRTLSQVKVSELGLLGYQSPNNLLGGLYIYKIQQWFEYFNRNQMLILQSETLYENPRETMMQVWDFLGLFPHVSDEYLPHNHIDYPAINPSLREILQTFFVPHNQMLESSLSRAFDWS